MNNINTVSNAGWVEQDVTSRLDYSQDWPALLTPGDSIVDSIWAPVAGVVFENAQVVDSTTSVWIEAATPGLYRITNTVLTGMGRRDSRTFLLVVSDSSGSDPVRSTLFYRDEFLAKFRSDRLPSVRQYLPADVSDDYLWSKLKAAEADAQRELHVFFVPTVLFPNEPTQAEIDALAGAPWAVDPGYDYDQDLIQPGGWTYLALRQKPIIALESIKFSFPSTGTVFTVPSVWIKLDKKYAHVRFIPAGSVFSLPMGGMMISAMGMQAAPQFIEVRYTAGLKDAAGDYPDLLDLVQRMVTARIMGDAVIPASGSISADGLSQSTSAPDLDKIQAGIDKMIEELRTRIHGVPFTVL